jgi:hypothetical protein
MGMIYFCCDENRRQAVRRHAVLNGIDFLEVEDNPADPPAKRQRTLLVHCLKDLEPGEIAREQVLIEGGERLRHIQVTGVASGGAAPPPLSPPPGAGPNVLIVQVDAPGDFSTYTLRLLKSAAEKVPPDRFDPLLAAVDFSFKAACPSDFDCKQSRFCPPETEPGPEINYLAKDYSSFRQLLLDRLAVLLPQWQERSPADLGIALVEVLAYVADYLSYQQDAVATEAYLGTARRRVSVRRHARLIDYYLSEGCNARAWVQVRVRDEVADLPLNKIVSRNQIPYATKVLTRVAALSPVVSPETPAFAQALAGGPQVFELRQDVSLYGRHNRLQFYTWGNRECCLPKGATRATLRDGFPKLGEGDVLILVEELGPLTGKPEDADPTHRHAVRLIRATVTQDPLGGQFDYPPHDAPKTVTEIEWHSDDALPFAFCLSVRLGTDYYQDVSVALGNIVLVDHGLTLREEPLNRVPWTDPVRSNLLPQAADRCQPPQTGATAPRFSPALARAPLTHAVAYDPGLSARAVLAPPVRQALPAITLAEVGVTGEWQPQRDLLDSGPEDKHFVVEIDTGGAAFLRFGDGQQGLQPTPGTRLLATYRVGNGASGNVGAEALSHLVTADPAIATDNSPVLWVWNPLPAQGGVDPEGLEEARQKAPAILGQQARAVTPADYAAVAQQGDPTVQRAAATLRWTGSWHTLFLTVDRFGGQEVDAGFKQDLLRYVDNYRMAGQDLDMDSPRRVPLEIAMQVCAKPDYFREHVKAALLAVFSNRTLPDGRRGVFHPDNFSFGQPVYLSRLYAAAQAVEGVAEVEIVKFQRQGTADTAALKSGRLDCARLEIACLDNDPNFPERGVFSLIMQGGR